MWWRYVLVCGVLVGGVCCNRNFPPGFKFGAATAAYQVEGAWNISDKSESIWDVFTHNKPEAIIDGSNGDVACDSYHLWKRDVEIASELGLHFYRFSISWTRLLPNGLTNHISEDGKKYYNDLIDALLAKGIEPVVTLYHWDLPQSLQKLGGWTNPLIVDWFGHYSRVVYSLYADRVKTWITINEPVIYCEANYASGIHAPGILSPGIGGYLCSKNSLLAHAKAWRIYDEEYRPKYRGKVSLTNQLMWFEPENEDEKESAEHTHQFWGGLYTHPIFSKEGGWPPALEKIIAEKSKQEGYAVSRLPPLTQAEKEFIRGTYDFFGFNFYTARTTRKSKEGEPNGLFTSAPDIGVQFSVRPHWKRGATHWFYIYPEGLRLQLSWVRQQFGDVDILILENGIAGHDTDLDDKYRVEFYKDHLEQVLLSIKEDGVRISGYTAWTMIDNFEWREGYRSKFGLYEVDFEDPLRTRRPRASARYFASVIKAHSLDVDTDNKGRPNGRGSGLRNRRTILAESSKTACCILAASELPPQSPQMLSEAYWDQPIRRYNDWDGFSRLHMPHVGNLVSQIEIFSLLWRGCWCIDLNFPPGFQFGAATSAYQVEGAWNTSDKGESIWDVMLHKDPSLISDGTNGDVACDSYHQYRADAQIAHHLGLHFYRFSVAWTRILPTGFPNRISKDGVKYYNKLIDALLEKGVEPVITLYHFDLPQSIQTLGGWTNPLIIDWFADYARIVFRLYADRVKTWITINEPLFTCDYTYNLGNMVPMVHEEKLGAFLCNKNVLLAHAKAWRIYDEDFKPTYHGKLSIANNPIWLEPASEKDEELTELAREFSTGRYSHPIYSAEGGWPPSVEKIMAEYSKKEGYPYSRLPLFTEEEKKFIRGTYDFYSLNHYTSRLVRAAHKNETPGVWFASGTKELNAVLETDPKWRFTDFRILVIAPKGIRSQIKWLQERYNNVSILITENGFATHDSEIYDTGRIYFIRDYLKEVLLAIKEDGANVIGYTVWSLMDNFEWMLGYTLKFGLYSVDFSDPMRTRTPRASALYYADVIKHNSLDLPHSSHQYRHLKRAKKTKDNTSATSSIKVDCQFILVISLGYVIASLMHYS